MPEKHAILSASAAGRWLECPPSAQLERKFKDTSSEAAQEGTLAHELGEINLKFRLDSIDQLKWSKHIKKIEVDPLFTPDMPEYVERYVSTCMEKIAGARTKTPDALFRIEQRLDYSEWAPHGFGTGDFCIISDGIIEIIDLKYGKGVPVFAEDNKQMRLYALGAIAQFSYLYKIRKIKMTIVQPRLDSITSDEISSSELLKWANEIVKPIAKLAYRGRGEYQAGDHCTFCRANAVCRARAVENMELAKYDFQEPPVLDTNEIAEILQKAEDLAKWAKNIKDYAQDQALAGVKYPGYKLVEGKSNRRYTQPDEIATILLGNGIQDIYKPIELLGLTAMEKSIGKKKLFDLIHDYIEKPQGKPTLVVDTDKREEYNTVADDFNDEMAEF